MKIKAFYYLFWCKEISEANIWSKKIKKKKKRLLQHKDILINKKKKKNYILTVSTYNFCVKFDRILKLCWKQ